MEDTPPPMTPSDAEDATRQKATTDMKIDALAEKVVALTDLLGQRMNHANDVNLLHGWRKAPTRTNATLTLASVLRYYERSMRRSTAVYYLIFGVLYTRSSVAISLQLAGTIHLTSLVARIVVGLFYLSVGVGNFLCILFPAEKFQLAMIFPSMGAAVAMLILTVTYALSAQNPTLAILSAIFWLAMMITHGGFGTAIRGRLGLRNFTLELADASEDQREEQHRTAPPVPEHPGV